MMLPEGAKLGGRVQNAVREQETHDISLQENCLEK